MNNLILKAIEAIKDNKTDYAIGLLEGALEMSDKEVKTGLAPLPYLVPNITPPNPYHFPTPITGPYIAHGTTGGSLDEGSLLEAEARSKVDKIKQLSQSSLEQ